MDKYTKVIEILKERTKDGNLYLLEALSDYSGFFVKDDSLIYAVENFGRNGTSKIDRTKFLTLLTNTKIYPQETNSLFDEGFYDLIEFQLDDEDLLKIFIELCTIHTEKNADIPIYDFFNTLSELLSNRDEKMYKNAIGCFGELSFMEYIKMTLDVSIARFWHLDGPYSRTDFSIGKYKLEVKTVQNIDPIIRIKEKQLRRSKDLFIIIICVSNTKDGESLSEKFDSIEKLGDDFNSFDFMLKLAQERNRIDPADFNKLRFFVEGIYIFPVSEIRMITKLPFEVSNLSYDYAFDVNKSMSCKELFETINIGPGGDILDE
ncbi:PD-(D/E)XK motif protein [Erysipelothrix rhusiopathiae]|uniref:PD-(D/E)XK motif protein n=1 Tax=Erysipelothrix rhusiopathiae TaxID=1648 RepID=UPI002954A9AA|nr:PD-(D/E)XK motif protein [Erysipelothrix rhusiopathiae]MDV7679701.1 PD-(D/E)XK motif protein [Erysipelothrix rhusiopathiae]